jgi:hypothetical protein
VVSRTEREFVYKKLNIFRTVHRQEYRNEHALVVQNILSFSYTNSFSIPSFVKYKLDKFRSRHRLENSVFSRFVDVDKYVFFYYVYGLECFI